MSLTINGSTNTLTASSGLTVSGNTAVTGTLSATTGAAVGGATAGAGGIAFPATQVAVADPNTLDDYEEGTWTPTIASSGGTITTVGAVSGTYTIIGKLVTINFNIIITTNGTGSGYTKIGGMPIPIPAYITGAGVEAGMTSKALSLSVLNSSLMYCVFYDNTYPGGDGYHIRGTVNYFQ